MCIRDRARTLGATRLIGVYRPTAKNGMVRDHYRRLGFVPSGEPDVEGGTEWVLALEGWTRLATAIASEMAAT